MPDVKPMLSAGAIRRSVNGADQKGVGSGRATVTEIIAGHFFDITAATMSRHYIGGNPSGSIQVCTLSF
jgi:hypothetical protein